MSESPRTVRWPIKAWWLLHVTLITLWCFPHPPPAVREGRAQGGPLDSLLAFNDNYVRTGPSRWYIEPFGLWQYWDMFAPDPLKRDYYFDAVLQYQDGTVKTVEFPRIFKMPVPEKYRKERFRKYGERVQDSDYQYLWPTWAQWMATQATTDRNNPVVALNLQKKVRDILPPSPNIDPNQPYETTMFHPQMVDQARLFRDKGWTR